MNSKKPIPSPLAGEGEGGGNMPRKAEELLKRARMLRKSSTPTEQILWRELRYRQLDNFKFRRQQIIGPYIVDFFCAPAKLVIELDGDSHIGKEEYDSQRPPASSHSYDAGARTPSGQAFLEKQGLTVLRFIDPEIYENLPGVLEVIWQHCPPPSPSPARGEGIGFFNAIYSLQNIELPLRLTPMSCAYSYSNSITITSTSTILRNTKFKNIESQLSKSA